RVAGLHALSHRPPRHDVQADGLVRRAADRAHLMPDTQEKRAMHAPDAGSAAAGAVVRPAPAAGAISLLQIGGWLLLAAVLIAFPAGAGGYLLFMATLVAINVIATAGLNITVGYAGLLSIGHSAFVGVGAYVNALMMIHLDTPLAFNLLFSGF